MKLMRPTIKIGSKVDDKPSEVLYMIWLVLVVVIFFWVLGKSKTKTKRRSGQIVSGITMSVEMVCPDPAEWAREREAAKKAKQESIEKLTASFLRPATLTEAVAGMQAAINTFAVGFHVAAPNFDDLWKICQGVELKKTELTIRKKMNESYKRRNEPTQLIESLAFCLLHARFMTENLNPAWKLSISIKRLITNLNHEKYRSRCIGFLYLFCDAVKSSSPDLATLCEDEIKKLFSCSYSDVLAKTNFESNISHLSEAKSASDKHFTLNALVEYLAKRRRYDPSVRDKLVGLCEEDIRLYKIFLTDFASIGEDKKTFEQALKSQYYMCPYLPSFNSIWEIYEEEGNKSELERLHKLAKEIKYGAYADDDALSDPGDEKPVTEKMKEPCPVDIIEIQKSGNKGKLAFLDSEGNACSTEEAVKDHFESLGYRVVRGEVQFWQAMFALSFWDEIFDGTGTPNGFNDIPSDLFSGDGFYRARKEQIESKRAFLETANIHEFITSQLRKRGKIWTRIIFAGGHQNFHYRSILESAEVTEFLRVINPVIFSKIVYRIATNPTENRAGTPDYSIWRGPDVSFIEVKGIRETIRESQIAWLTWMHTEGMPVKIVRVKGKALEVDTAA